VRVQVHCGLGEVWTALNRVEWPGQNSRGFPAGETLRYISPMHITRGTMHCMVISSGLWACFWWRRYLAEDEMDAALGDGVALVRPVRGEPPPPTGDEGTRLKQVLRELYATTPDMNHTLPIQNVR
jgi:hypothetical protein